MKPGQVISLPKVDNRYKDGNIKKDKSGRWRGNSRTVELQRVGGGLNAPLTATEPLMKWMRKQGVIL